jgi:hypothetical protein
MANPRMVCGAQAMNGETTHVASNWTKIVGKSCDSLAICSPLMWESTWGYSAVGAEDH